MDDLNGATPMESHIAETKAALAEIKEDLDCLIERKEETNMSEGFDSGALMGMLANKGIDPGVVAMLNDRTRNGGWGEDGGSWIILLFLFLLGMGGNGFWGNRDNNIDGVDRTVVNEANYSRLLDAVSTNGTRQEMAISQLAQSLNVNNNAISAALAGIDKSLAVNNGDFKSAIQSVENALSSQLASCCCATRQLVAEQGCQTRQTVTEQMNALSTQLSAHNYNMASQFAAQTQLITDKFNALELRTLEDQNARLREQIAAQSQEAQTALILAAINGSKLAVNGTVNTTAGTWTGNGSLST